MKELFESFQPEYKNIPDTKDVQYVSQLMEWMGEKFPEETIKNLMFWITEKCLNTKPFAYQIGQDENSVEIDVPYYARSGNVQKIMVPAGFNTVLTLPYRMQPVMVGLVEAASLMRWDGNNRFVEYHKQKFMEAITKVLV